MYYILEHQKRPDGQVNVSETARSNYNLALSYYHDRYSKMCVTDLYEYVALSLVDEQLNVAKHDVVNTLYVFPTEEGEQ